MALGVDGYRALIMRIPPANRCIDSTDKPGRGDGTGGRRRKHSHKPSTPNVEIVRTIYRNFVGVPLDITGSRSIACRRRAKHCYTVSVSNEDLSCLAHGHVVYVRDVRMQRSQWLSADRIGCIHIDIWSAMIGRPEVTTHDVKVPRGI